MRFLVAVIVILCATPSLAGPPVEAAKHGEACKRNYELADFKLAIEECKAAYTLYPAPALLFVLGQAHRKLGDNEKALYFYRQYLIKAPDGESRKAADEQVKRLEPLVIAMERTRAAPPQGITGEEDNTRAATSTPTVTTPPNVVYVERQAVTTSTAPWYRHPAPWSVGALGVVALAIGSGLAGAAPGIELDATRAMSLQARADLQAKADAYRVSGFVLVGIGSAAIVGAAIGFGVLGAKQKNQKTAFDLVPSTTGFFMAVSRRF
jgi:tetratricopeptide (TPR) repeat protein